MTREKIIEVQIPRSLYFSRGGQGHLFALSVSKLRMLVKISRESTKRSKAEYIISKLVEQEKKEIGKSIQNS